MNVTKRFEAVGFTNVPAGVKGTMYCLNLLILSSGCAECTG